MNDRSRHDKCNPERIKARKVLSEDYLKWNKRGSKKGEHAEMMGSFTAMFMNMGDCLASCSCRSCHCLVEKPCNYACSTRSGINKVNMFSANEKSRAAMAFFMSLRVRMS